MILLDFKELFAKNLKIIRTIKGLTQTELADKIGIQPQSVSIYESGENFLIGENLGKITLIKRKRSCLS